MQHEPENPDDKSKGKSVRESATNPGPEIDSELQAHIGRHLKASYDDILEQSVPDRFVELLKKLEAREEAPEKGGRE